MPIGYFQKRASALLHAAQAGDDNALARIRAVIHDGDVTLMKAQHVIAVEGGFTKWADLLAASEIEVRRIIATQKSNVSPMILGDRASSGERRDLVLGFHWNGTFYLDGRRTEAPEGAHGSVLRFFERRSDPTPALVPFEGKATELRRALGQRDLIPPLALPVVDSEPLAIDEPGLYVVLGALDTGKTALTTLLTVSNVDRCSLTRIGVPDGAAQSHPSNYSTMFDRALRSPLPFHCIDSLRLLTVDALGFDIKNKRHRTGFWGLVLDLRWLAHAANRIVLATVNPMVDPEGYARFRDRLIEGCGVNLIEVIRGNVSGSGRSSLFGEPTTPLRDATIEARLWLRRRSRPWVQNRLVRLHFADASALDDPPACSLLHQRARAAQG